MLLAYVFPMYSVVYAATEPTFEVTCESPMGDDGVAQTKELILYYGVKNFTGFSNLTEKGITVFRGALEYDTNVFEPIEINLTEEGLFSGYKTSTKDGKAPLQPATSGWGGVYYNPETEQYVTDHGDSLVNSEMNVLKVVLKVKGSANLGNTIVTLRNIEAGNTEKDIYPSNANNSISKTITIVPLITDPTDPDPENGFGGYIRIAPETTVAELLSVEGNINFTTLSSSTGNVLSDTDYVSTGSISIVNDLTYKFIAVGDLDSNGKMSAKDLARLNALLTRQATDLTDDEKRAADIRWDLELKGTDLARMSSLMVGLGHSTVTKWYGTGEKHCYPVSR